MFCFSLASMIHLKSLPSTLKTTMALSLSLFLIPYPQPAVHSLHLPFSLSFQLEVCPWKIASILCKIKASYFIPRNQDIALLLTVLILLGIEGFIHCVFNFVADQESLSVLEGCYNTVSSQCYNI